MATRKVLPNLLKSRNNRIGMVPEVEMIPKQALIDSTKVVIAPRGHKRAKRGNLIIYNQSLGDCFVAMLLAMTR
jgi:hypothetical protein